jgi:hypothetical protein
VRHPAENLKGALRVNIDHDQKKALLITGTYQLSEVETKIKSRCEGVFESRWNRLGDRFVIPHALVQVGLDALVRARLKALGYTVVEKEDGSATTLDVRDKAIVVISSSVDVTRVRREFYEAAVPMVGLNMALFKSLLMPRASEDKADGNSSTEPAADDLAASPETTDVSIEVGRAHATLGRIRASDEFRQSKAITIIALTETSESPMVVLGCESGVEVDGLKVPSKRAGFFSEDGNPASTTSSSWLPLFDTAINWAGGVQALRRFDEVFKEEWREIHQRRLCYGAETEFDGRHAPRNLAGLALSGGGIRSATFSLGLLQGLHELKLLHLFDYLSTVSGGGYVGGWWSAWLSRDERCTEKAAVTQKLEEPDQVEEIKRALEVKDAAPVGLQPNGGNSSIFPPSEIIELGRPYQQGSKVAEGAKGTGIDPVHHLRLFANYLTPRKGALSGDTWRAVSIVTRNLALTWLVLIPMLIAVVLVGKLYFVLQPTAAKNYLHAENDIPRLLIRLDLMAQPLVFLVGWIIVMSFLWLMCSKDRPSASDVILLFVSLLALLALGLCGLYFLDLWIFVPATGHYSSPQLIAGLGLWLLGAVILVGYALWPVQVDAIADKAEKEQWRMEVRRSRSSHVQSKLMVVLAVTTVVLGFSGFGHVAVEYLLNSKWPGLGILLPVFATLAGSIFTAYRATPSGGGDKRDTGEPSRISRLVFAITPPLVVILLALGIAWGVHHLLLYLIQITPTAGQSQEYALVGLYSPYALATLFSLFLCAVLALQEIKWQKIKPSATILAAICLVALSAIYSAIKAMVIIVRTVPRPLAIVLSIFLVLLLVFIPVRSEATKKILKFINGMRRLSAPTTPDKKPADWDSYLASVFQGLARERVRTALALASVIIGAALLYVFSPKLIDGLWAFSNSKTGMLWLNLWPLVIAILAGSLILFRLAVKESSEQCRAQGKQFPFEPAIFENMIRERKVGALWLIGCLSIVLPIAVSSWLHVLTKHPLAVPANFSLTDNLSLTYISTSNERLSLIILPFVVAGLGLSILFFRAAVIEMKRESEQAAPGLTFRLLSKMKWVAERERQAVKILAAVCLVLAIFLGWGTVELVPDSQQDVELLAQIVREATANFSRLAGPTDSARQQLAGKWLGMIKHLSGWLALLATLWLSLILFRSTVIEMKGGSDRQQRAIEWRIFKTEWVRTRHRRKIFTLLALTCIVLAGLLGGVFSVASRHFEEYSRQSFPAFPLVAIVPCFIFTLFELKWGEGDNRRALWLLFSAYLVAVLLTIIYFLPTGDNMLLRIIIALLAIELAWVIALGWTVDPNAVSMHQFYKSRLVRAYLGASNKRRRGMEIEITDAVAGDDVLLKNLKGCRRGGPYHLINTTLNLVAGRDLATAQRSAAAFVLSSRFCGSSRTGYRRSSEYMDGRLSLGTAIAASGAAVSPSMGSMKPTAALAMLMTILNVRLGFWAPTPDRIAWTEGQARLWPFYLLREFLSQTNDLSTYCYLTDGGHFDNTGLYALVERGCRFVVLADCGADPEPCFEDLGTAIRRCRIDFGTEIELNLKPFMRDRKKHVKQHFIAGKIKYSREHAERLGWKTAENNNGENEGEHTGILVVFKPVLVGNETADVRQYAIENSDFPQQTTAEQWFDEAQFESYRRLGQFCAQSAFENLDTIKEIKSRTVNKDTPTFHDIEAIFKEMIGNPKAV